MVAPAGGIGGPATEEWEGVDEPDGGDFAQDFHDPDPWGDAEPVAPVPPRPTPPARRAAPSPTGAQTPGRKSRLPKMAQWRNGTMPRT